MLGLVPGAIPCPTNSEGNLLQGGGPNSKGQKVQTHQVPTPCYRRQVGKVQGSIGSPG